MPRFQDMSLEHATLQSVERELARRLREGAPDEAMALAMAWRVRCRDGHPSRHLLGPLLDRAEDAAGKALAGAPFDF